MSPVQLADELGIDPKRLRAWLRSQWQGPGKGATWDLTADQVEQARARFAGSPSSGAAHRAVTPVVVLRPSVEAWRAVEEIADWSEWVLLSEAVPAAPQVPAVYMARDGEGTAVYVGMAGERRGQGVRGRLRLYTSGKAAVSGLGEAAFDRALADPIWVRERLAELEEGTALRAKEWARLAVDRACLQVRWATVSDRPAASRLEREVLTILQGEELWNRLR